MNKTIIFTSFIASMVLINFGMSAKARVDKLRYEAVQMQANNLDMKQKINDRESLVKRGPVLLSIEYGLVMSQIRMLESCSGTDMNVQLEGFKDADDISDHYVDTEYEGVRGLKIKIVVDKFSKETDMGAVLDDIHLLEKNTDFMVSEISKDKNNLIVKGEIYGL
ncbi:MAG: hypothetical protein HQL12_01145 [Candidatus Omnitrophica bacterium]|nr:hypothetical protein [Candidatus Omnitrophota bacterium]